MTKFNYTLLKTDGKARRGRIDTAHGPIETPVFMPVGTVGSVKAMRLDELEDMGEGVGASMILGNTYHLFLRPGHKNVDKLGGLHKFMRWPGPILTDSGGYQVFSLTKMRKMSEEGCKFKAHTDGQWHMLTPELSTEIQHDLDSTVTMAFDECTPYPAEYGVARESMALSMRWAQRSRDAFVPREGYGQFGIQQGSMYEDLRQQSTDELTAIGFEGYAIGGLAVGEESEILHKMIPVCADMLPEDKPRYLMGVGYPSDMIKAVQAGVDMFDCVLPTRNARNGQAFVHSGVINIKRSEFALDESPLDPLCKCKTCAGGYSKAYLRHLWRENEILGHMLITTHNLYFYINMMAELRAAIEAGNLDDVAEKMLQTYR